MSLPNAIVCVNCVQVSNATFDKVVNALTSDDARVHPQRILLFTNPGDAPFRVTLNTDKTAIKVVETIRIVTTEARPEEMVHYMAGYAQAYIETGFDTYVKNYLQMCISTTSVLQTLIGTFGEVPEVIVISDNDFDVLGLGGHGKRKRLQPFSSYASADAGLASANPASANPASANPASTDDANTTSAKEADEGLDDFDRVVFGKKKPRQEKPPAAPPSTASATGQCHVPRATPAPPNSSDNNPLGAIMQSMMSNPDLMNSMMGAFTKSMTKPPSGARSNVPSPFDTPAAFTGPAAAAGNAPPAAGNAPPAAGDAPAAARL